MVRVFPATVFTDFNIKFDYNAAIAVWAFN